ncbi:uncharacterized protein EURHEDRAFT_149776 [Aspergillus ruber CBS 135680]|uniref:Uncharacterized protein n=1 Tax=Aspergillus ruber (strain CBS 135680) TaxID=1388766 RepID=A0A017S961_ASPRC|nr:uncharacterized protein EURHEDRAFT_149776 [Aspergillus ruber CBS 135680]EYE93487.1 hypothetical protein EURHEDRAFT_149776 [Aspergillus ruber CBS 135680]
MRSKRICNKLGLMWFFFFFFSIVISGRRIRRRSMKRVLIQVHGSLWKYSDCPRLLYWSSHGLSLLLMQWMRANFQATLGRSFS